MVEMVRRSERMRHDDRRQNRTARATPIPHPRSRSRNSPARPAATRTKPRPGSKPCDRDLSTLAGTRSAPFIHYPVIAGHERSGHIAQTGDTVDWLAAGDPVVGDGTLRLPAVQVSRAAGAAMVTALGLDQQRFAIAQELGADQIRQAKPSGSRTHAQPGHRLLGPIGHTSRSPPQVKINNQTPAMSSRHITQAEVTREWKRSKF